MVQLEVEHGRVNSFTSRGSADPDLCRPRCCHRCHPQWLKLIDISWMNGDNTPSPLFAVRSGPWPRFGPQWISAGSEPVPRSVLALIDFWLLLCHHFVVAVCPGSEPVANPESSGEDTSDSEDETPANGPSAADDEYVTVCCYNILWIDFKIKYNHFYRTQKLHTYIHTHTFI